MSQIPPDHAPAERPRHFYALMAILVSSSVLGPMGMTIMLPSLPAIGRALNAGPASLPLVLTIYLIGLAIGQLIAGPLADRLGRRPVILGGLALAAVVSVMAALSTGIEMLVVMRFFQAMAAAACLATGRAVMRDLFDRERAAAALGWMVTVQGMGPTVSPMIGGMLDNYFGWRAPLYAYMAVSIAIFIAGYFIMPETARTSGAGHGTVRMGASFKFLLTQRSFLAYFAALALGLSPYFIFLALAGPVVVNTMGLSSAQYGVWLTFGGSGFMVGTMMVGSFSRRLGIDRLVTIGLLLGVCAVALGLALSMWFSWLGPITLFFPLFIYSIGNGIVLPGSMAGAVSIKPGLAGTASGIGGFGQAICGAGLAQIYGILLYEGATGVSIMAGMTSISVLALVVFSGLLRGRGALPRRNQG